MLSSKQTARRTNLNARFQRGVSMIEALVSIVLLVLGVLSVLGVQLSTLVNTQNSVRRAQAVRIIEDLSERIKTNPNRFSELPNYAMTGWDAVATASVSSCSSASGCNSTDLAKWDLQSWFQSVSQAMPNATVRTFLPATVSNPPQLGVMIGWYPNERDAKHRNDSNFTKPLEVKSKSDNSGVNCLTGRICHLAYIQL